MSGYKYLFGPVPSRRLGASLGVSPIPERTCNYSCVYCQLGRTLRMTNTRQEFFPLEEILAEFREYLQGSIPFDVVTVVGEGEPTLYSRLGELIAGLKKETDKPVAVITNGALLYDAEMRRELMEADIVLPSLDAVTEEQYRKIDRPMGSIGFAEMAEGLRQFAREYQGQLWIEIMLVDGMNDSPEDIAAFKEFLGTMTGFTSTLRCVRQPRALCIPPPPSALTWLPGNWAASPSTSSPPAVSSARWRTPMRRS